MTYATKSSPQNKLDLFIKLVLIHRSQQGRGRGRGRGDGRWWRNRCLSEKTRSELNDSEIVAMNLCFQSTQNNGENGEDDLESDRDLGENAITNGEMEEIVDLTGQVASLSVENQGKGLEAGRS